MNITGHHVGVRSLSVSGVLILYGSEDGCFSLGTIYNEGHIRWMSSGMLNLTSEFDNHADFVVSSDTQKLDLNFQGTSSVYMSLNIL